MNKNNIVIDQDNINILNDDIESNINNNTVNNVIKKDKLDTINLLIKNKKCKRNFSEILYNVNIGIILASTITIFISSSLEKDNYNIIRGLNIGAGVLNILNMSGSKLITDLNKKINDIQNNINKKLKNFNELFYIPSNQNL